MFLIKFNNSILFQVFTAFSKDWNYFPEFEIENLDCNERIEIFLTKIIIWLFNKHLSKPWPDHTSWTIVFSHNRSPSADGRWAEYFWWLFWSTRFMLRTEQVKFSKYFLELCDSSCQINLLFLQILAWREALAPPQCWCGRKDQFSQFYITRSLLFIFQPHFLYLQSSEGQPQPYYSNDSLI